jgi:nucleoid-associated protein YgaU
MNKGACNMKRTLILLAASLFIAATSFAQDMTKDEWQQEMNRYTQLRNEQKAKLDQLTNEVNSSQAQSSKLDGDIDKCLDELYALVGSDRQKAAAYDAELTAAERTADELLRLSDTDLQGRANDVRDLAATAKRLRADKLSLIPDFSTRLDALDQKVASLQNAMGVSNLYTVGRWSRTRDCLWNISKKQDIYGNAWQWPKLWMGNQDQIKNPDIIHPGQKLKVPAKGEMTAEEKSAAKRYYARKSAGGTQ